MESIPIPIQLGHASSYDKLIESIGDSTVVLIGGTALLTGQMLVMEPKNSIKNES